MEKTYKREVGGVLMAFLLCLFLWGIWNEQAAEAARFLTMPVFLFFTAAFGMDAVAKQLR